MTRPIVELYLPEIPFLEETSLKKLLEHFNTSEDQTYVVGGAIRNFLLEQPLGDIDLATTFKPEAIVEGARSLGFHTICVGQSHGTIMVHKEGKHYEITTLREDIKTDGRHALVRFGRDFFQDARRRDFTINALFLTPSGKVLDYVGGLSDIFHQRVRFIGEAAQRIREDYLRILRFFRFQATYGLGRPEDEALKAIAQEKEGLRYLSRERIREELFKLFCTPHAATILPYLERLELFPLLLHSRSPASKSPPPSPAFSDTSTHESKPLETSRDGIKVQIDLARFAFFRQIQDVNPSLFPEPSSGNLKAERDLLGLRYLSALMLQSPSQAKWLQECLALSHKETEYLFKIATGFTKWQSYLPNPPSAEEIREEIFWNGPIITADCLHFLQAEAQKAKNSWPTPHLDIIEEGWSKAFAQLHFRPPSFPLRGRDLLRYGMKAGPDVGRLLESLTKTWIRLNFPVDSFTLESIIQQNVQDFLFPPREIEK